MYTKEQQLLKIKSPKISDIEREYLNWLQQQNHNCFVCGISSNIEMHHVTDINRISGKRRVHSRLVPLCISCHRTGKNAIHVLSKEYFYKNIKSLDELLVESNRLYNDFLSSI